MKMKRQWRDLCFPIVVATIGRKSLCWSRVALAKSIMSHILNCKKKNSPENFLIFWYVLALWICILYAKKNWGVMSLFFLLQNYEWLGTFYDNVCGNNREIPFVGVVSVLRTGLCPCQLLVCNQFRRQLKVFIFPGVSNCLIVVPAYDRGHGTCDKSKALFNPLEYDVMQCTIDYTLRMQNSILLNVQSEQKKRHENMCTMY